MLATWVEQRSMKLFNKYITSLKYMILYNNIYTNTRLMYKKRSLIDKNKKYYNQCQFLYYNNIISQLILLLTCQIVINI